MHRHLEPACLARAAEEVLAVGRSARNERERRRPRDVVPVGDDAVRETGARDGRGDEPSDGLVREAVDRECADTAVVRLEAQVEVVGRCERRERSAARTRVEGDGERLTGLGGAAVPRACHAEVEYQVRGHPARRRRARAAWALAAPRARPHGWRRCHTGSSRSCRRFRPSVTFSVCPSVAAL